MREVLAVTLIQRLNRPPVATGILVFSCVLLTAMLGFAVWQIVSIPAGVTAAHDADFGPFATVAMGLPLLILYAGGLARLRRGEEVPALIIWVALVNLSALALALASTR